MLPGLVTAMAAVANLTSMSVTQLVESQFREFGHSLMIGDCDVLAIGGYGPLPHLWGRSSLHADRLFFAEWPRIRVATEGSTCLVTLIGSVPEHVELKTMLRTLEDIRAPHQLVLSMAAGELGEESLRESSIPVPWIMLQWGM